MKIPQTVILLEEENVAKVGGFSIPASVQLYRRHVGINWLNEKRVEY